jgi:hypothetical protein
MAEVEIAETGADEEKDDDEVVGGEEDLGLRDSNRQDVERLLSARYGLVAGVGPRNLLNLASKRVPGELTSNDVVVLCKAFYLNKRFSTKGRVATELAASDHARDVGLIVRKMAWCVRTNPTIELLADPDLMDHTFGRDEDSNEHSLKNVLAMIDVVQKSMLHVS